MLRKVASRVAWAGRTASMVFGLALILALLFGVASLAFARDGQSFVLGTRNVASSVSTLVKQGAGPALSLQVDSGPPLAVNSQTKVAKLNTDTVDGKDSTALLPGGILPRGRTVRGAYVIRFDPVAAGRSASESISFGYKLSSEPTSVFVPVGTTPPTGCPGSASNPEAAPGFLCVYENSNVRTTNTVLCNPVSNTCGIPVSRYGGYLRTDSTGTGASTRTVGTWAVTGS